ncbi:MAG: aminotransferase class III-fold pyridoxal phosphate-dependent enzyme, partial [Gemmatimonadota bacterium]
EAVEAALKLARQYWVESGRPSKHRIIALSPAYHGNTLLALSASAREHYKTYFREWLVDVIRIPAPYAYRCNCAGDPECRVCTGQVLEDAILREGAENIAAFIAEPVGGSSTGATIPRDGYWARVREICDRHEVLLIADEVLSGAGRTGTWSALEPTGVRPDIMTLGKGIGAGFVPLSAMLTTRRITDPIANGSGAFLHAQTFSHHAVLCAAGVATLEYLAEQKLVERCATMGAVLHRKLEALRDLPLVGDVRGKGLLAGIEFVADKTTRAPFPRAKKLAEKFAQAALDEGLIIWPNVGQADGTNGDLALLAPPFIITEEEIDELVLRFRRAIETVSGER